MKKRDDVYISQILERIAKVKNHIKGLSQAKFLKSDLHKAAVVRELEVIGEAARMVAEETKAKFPAIPWPQIVGMRNRLIHEYFNVDDTIVWEVVNSQLPILEKEFEKVFIETAPPAHPWRNCPIGYYFVHEFPRRVAPSQKNPLGITSVREHCRKNPSGKDQLYPDEILLISTSAHLDALVDKIGQMEKPNNANDFDRTITLWVQFWNSIFLPASPLSPNIVKALFFSESSFNLKVKSQKIGRGNYARGPMQISDETRKALADEKGEIQDHYITLTAKDVENPELAIAAATRWLFHKKALASSYLKREATWLESVAHYKGYLRSKKDFRKQKGMSVFIATHAKLEEGSKR